MDRTVLREALRFSVLSIVLAGIIHGPALAKGAQAAPPTETFPTCSWDHPGHDPFMGDVVAAVDRYQDIPPDVRHRLQARMAKRQYDDIVSIRRDSITGQGNYRSAIRDMHFGTHQVCRTVTRTSWTPQMQERGLVYCESGQCILVPTVCRNVSRIARSEVAAEHVEHAEVPDEPAAPVAAAPATFAAVGPGATDVASMSTPLALDNSPAFGAESAGYVPSGGGLIPVVPAVPTASGQVFSAGMPATFASPGASGQVFSAGMPATFASPAPAPAPAPVPGDSVAPSVAPAMAPVPSDVAAVPEPQTWALMLGGLAAVAALRYRRQGRRSSGAR